MYLNIFLNVLLFLINCLFLYFVKNDDKTEVKKKEINTKNKKINIGLLTNELPPIIYGGVSTWVLNFMKMYENDDNYNVIPIFLAYNDDPTEEMIKKYKKIRIIKYMKDIKEVFKDIDICVNNLWIALDTIKQINNLYPELIMISVCHSLIKMEHLTNLGSQYTSNYYEQEITFKNSDYVVLISKAEEKYYKEFGYTKYKAIPTVIYNSYKPKYDEYFKENKNNELYDYSNDNIGYIGRHVPRKRPELALKAVVNLDLDIKVFNMGVDFKNGNNDYWMELKKKHDKLLNIIPFTSDKKKINDFWKKVGANCITGIYEPFGYTMCETLDRGIPAIVQNIDGPSEIVNDVLDNVYIYEVDKKDFSKDIKNLSKAINKFINTDPEKRKENCLKARKALDRFRPENIKKDWDKVFNESLSEDFKKKKLEKIKTEKSESIKVKKNDNLSYGYKFWNNFLSILDDEVLDVEEEILI